MSTDDRPAEGDLLFAYGTLRRSATGAPAAVRDALAKSTSLGGGRVAARLHWLGDYPAIVRSRTDLTIGDVYRIDQALWPALDSWEGAAYVRERVPVTLEDGTIVEAFAYLARDAAALGARIASGDFLNP